MWNVGLEEAQAAIKIARKNTNNLRYTDDTTLMAESEEELKSLLMKVKEESEKPGLKLNIQRTNIIKSSPITSRQIDGKTMGTVTDLIFKSLRTMTAPWNEKTLWKKNYDKPRQCITKQRHHLPTKVHIVKAMFFPVVIYGCESWTTKKAERWKIDAFELQCWRRLLRVPWTARRSNQSNLKEINPEYSLEGLMLKLKLQYFGHLMQNQLSGKDPDAGKHWGQQKGMTGWDDWMASLTQQTWVWANSGRWWRTAKPGMLQSMGSQTVEHNWVAEQQEEMKSYDSLV